jgi:hypothetical protein
LLGEAVKVDLVSLGGTELLLPAALPGVAEYVTVAHAEAEADSLLVRLGADLDERGEIPCQSDAPVVLGFYAAAGTAVTEAVAGLEGFANHHLGRYFDGAAELEHGGKTFDERTARDIPLNERLGMVVPTIAGRPRPTSEKWWPTLRRVQALAALRRHGVTGAVTRSGLEGEKKLVQRFCDREYAGAARMMLDAYECLSPGWIDEERLRQLPPAPGT